VSHPTILIRLDKESPKKCSLTPLRERDDLGLTWHRVRLGDEVIVGKVVLLHPDGPLLSKSDASLPLCLIDSSWRDLPRVMRGVSGEMHLRSLPENLVTAYPRKSTLFDDPAAGLATIEALHAAWACLGVRDDSLLQGYYWAEDYLKSNAEVLRDIQPERSHEA